MIRTEMINERIRHYSDAGFKIKQKETGNVYEDAVDIYPCPYTYEETSEPIDYDEEAVAEDYEEALGRFGV